MRLAPTVWLGALVALNVSCAAGRPDSRARAADPRRILEDMRRELGPGSRGLVVAGVFGVATDSGARELEDARGTIERTVKFLETEFDIRLPRKPVRVYCLRDAPSYAAHARRMRGMDPSTPFGFYVPDERRIVVNVETGTGTLAHEVVHPLLMENFPDAPPWLHEGLASLFEHSITLPDGRLAGRSNWRLKNLRESLVGGGAPLTLAQLLSLPSADFYSRDPGTNYAAARYLILYLQELGVLANLYKEMRATIARDPTGVATLEKVTRRKVPDLEREWRLWVETLE